MGPQFLEDLGKLDNLLDLTLETSPSSIAALAEHSDLPPPFTNSTFIQLRKLYMLGDIGSISRVLNYMHKLIRFSKSVRSRLLDALFRNYFYVPCDRRYYDYPIRQRTLERTLPSFDFILLPSLQIEQCDKLRDQKILVIGIRRRFPVPSLRFPKIEEFC